MLKVYYVLDPMCSWCWAFRNSWLNLLEVMPDDVEVKYVLGGLAPDSDAPMPTEMRQTLQQVWAAISARTGTEFNMDFWAENTPRRSTYPACRAVIAASRMQPGALPDMVYAIQQAYYLKARNPSDPEVLAECARSIGLDTGEFLQELTSDNVDRDFQNNLQLSRLMGVQGFPAVVAVLQEEGQPKPAYYPVVLGYCDPDTLVSNWNSHFSPAA